jgi:signal transduction histidine kinase
VSVQDTGVGIKQEDLALLFKFFGKVSSTKDINQSGMGLGLTISKMLVEKFGGDIGVTSQPMAGSTFYFTLPYQDLACNHEA